MPRTLASADPDRRRIAAEPRIPIPSPALQVLPCSTTGSVARGLRRDRDRDICNRRSPSSEPPTPPFSSRPSLTNHHRSQVDQRFILRALYVTISVTPEAQKSYDPARAKQRQSDSRLDGPRWTPVDQSATCRVRSELEKDPSGLRVGGRSALCRRTVVRP